MVLTFCRCGLVVFICIYVLMGVLAWAGNENLIHSIKFCIELIPLGIMGRI